MSEILSISMRPRRLSELVGQKALVTSIRKQMTSRPPAAWLLHGGTGTGKTTTARILAAAFQCPHQGKLWGEPCDACWKTMSQFAINEINASEINGVEEIGKLADMAKYRPMPPSLKRVFILDEAQLLSTQSQNLLLKHFEDAPPHMVWIICTTAPTKILPTLRRRCVTYQLKGLGYEARQELLERTSKAISLDKPIEPLIEGTAEAGISSPALLLMALEKYASGATVPVAIAGTDAPGANSLRICKAVTSGNWNELKKYLAEAAPEEARWVRASILGWLRGGLIREASPKRQSTIASAIVELTAIAPLEDAMLMWWLWGTLYKVTRKFRVSGA